MLDGFSWMWWKKCPIWSLKCFMWIGCGQIHHFTARRGEGSLIKIFPVSRRLIKDTDDSSTLVLDVLWFSLPGWLMCLSCVSAASRGTLAMSNDAVCNGLPQLATARAVTESPLHLLASWNKEFWSFLVETRKVVRPSISSVGARAQWVNLQHEGNKYCNLQITGSVGRGEASSISRGVWSPEFLACGLAHSCR